MEMTAKVLCGGCHRIMWNKDNIPNEIELKKMKAKLLKELEKHV